MNDRAILAAVREHTANRYGLRIRDKRRSPFMWTIYVVAFMWLWLRNFMTGYFTTIAGRCYAPGALEPHDWRTVAHEGRHAAQSRAIGEPWFSLAYLFPLSLLALTLPAAVVAIAAGAPWYLAPLALVPAAPWPAPWRVKYEAQAYTMTAIADAMSGLDIGGAWYLDYQASHFGRAYYWPMWRGSARRLEAARIVATAIAAVEAHARACQPEIDVYPAAIPGVDSYLVDMMNFIRRAS